MNQSALLKHALSDEEHRRILTKLARHSDPAVKLKALDFIWKLKEREPERQRAAPDMDSLSRQILKTGVQSDRYGGGVVVLMWLSMGGDLASLPALRDVHNNCMRGAPWLWERPVAEQPPAIRAELERRLAEPKPNGANLLPTPAAELMPTAAEASP